jgi:exopolyphosphatase/guanosine-5'-triphosphate,3'-diphosphate pyrophosphatase
MAEEATRRRERMLSADDRIGVIDLGSNSIRLVVYDGLSRAPATLFNERVLCGLGRGLGRTGKLNEDGRKLALENLARFALLARQMKVERLDVLATAAVRDASDGPAFVTEATRRCKVPIQVLSGREEARLSALGVLSGMPEADGIMGDLGGGSLELVELQKGRIGEQGTLPLGPLRLMEAGDSEGKRARETVDEALAGLPWLDHCRGRVFYAVGGAWRAIARVHIEQTRYPLHVIHHYRVPSPEMIEVCRLIARQSRKSLEAVPSVSRKRLETLPLAALVLQRVLRESGAADVVFSALGIREGQLFALLPEAQKREDPLIVACASLALADARFEPLGEALFRWTAPLFPDEKPARARLRKAACHLADIAWREHPDYRAEHACLRILRLPIAGIDHPSRAFVAIAVCVRYDGRLGGPEAALARPLIDEKLAEEAVKIGLALRVAIAISGGAARLLSRTTLSLDGDRMMLHLPKAEEALAEGEAMRRRFTALAEAFGRKAVVQAG